MRKTTEKIVAFFFAIMLLFPIFGDAVHAIPVGGEEFVVENGMLALKLLWFGMFLGVLFLSFVFYQKGRKEKRKEK